MKTITFIAKDRAKSTAFRSLIVAAVFAIVGEVLYWVFLGNSIGDLRSGDILCMSAIGDPFRCTFAQLVSGIIPNLFFVNFITGGIYSGLFFACAYIPVFIVTYLAMYLRAITKNAFVMYGFIVLCVVSSGLYLSQRMEDRRDLSRELYQVHLDTLRDMKKSH